MVTTPASSVVSQVTSNPSPLAESVTTNVRSNGVPPARCALKVAEPAAIGTNVAIPVAPDPVDRRGLSRLDPRLVGVGTLHAHASECAEANNRESGEWGDQGSAQEGSPFHGALRVTGPAQQPPKSSSRGEERERGARLSARRQRFLILVANFQ